MSEKEIEKKILNYDIEIPELEKYLEDYFDEVVRGMICALFVLLRHDGKNSLLIKQIIDEIEKNMPRKYWPYPTYEDIIYSV